MENLGQPTLYKEYKQQLDIYKGFCGYLEGQLNEILRTEEVLYYELSSRVKTWDSIIEKIERKSLSVTTLKDIHDLIGLRIITLFKRDVSAICNTIRENFQVLWEDDKAEGKPDDAFGYLSVHFEIGMPESWLQSPVARKYAGLKAELQVRTFSQHVWAASSHLLKYKREAAIPYAMRRNINRLSAVLEIVDDELESILKAKETYQLSLKEAFNRQKEQNDQALDVVLLEHILDEAFKGENKKPQEPFDDLLGELFFCGVKTVGELQELLSSEAIKIRSLEAAQSEVNGQPFYSYVGRVRIALRAHFPSTYAKLRNRS